MRPAGLAGSRTHRREGAIDRTALIRRPVLVAGVAAYDSGIVDGVGSRRAQASRERRPSGLRVPNAARGQIRLDPGTRPGDDAGVVD